MKRRLGTAAKPYAPAHSGAILGLMKTRHQFYLPEQPDTLAKKPCASKTQILAEALRSWIDCKAVREFDKRFGPKRDQLATYSDGNRCRVDGITEMLAQFIQHQLTLVAHQPPFDADARRLGEDRP